ncbi:MAG TPA: helix-turn-helix domain-containing protein [Planktothrix sp.]|jgi:DNA-binding XRE family transcriptional regulator
MKLPKTSKVSSDIVIPISGGDCHTVHFHGDFYEAFKSDLKYARGLVLVLSPYIKAKRILQLREAIEDCIKRGVRVCVFIQRPPSFVLDDDQRRLELNEAIKLLTDMGVHVTELPAVHAKVAIIDDEIAWDGSLNILSHLNTEERMTRWQSKAKVDEIIKSHGLDCCGSCGQRPGFCINLQKNLSEFAEKQRCATGEAIAVRRKAFGLSQRDLADLSGISQAYIAQIEKGTRDVSINTLAMIGRVLKTQFKPIPLHLEPCVEQLTRTRGRETIPAMQTAASSDRTKVAP